MTQSNVSEELLHIRKRARRRLVGAVALVLFALTVLWTVLDNAPPPQFSSGHPIEIISSAPALVASRSAVVAVVQTSSTPEYLRPPVDAAPVTSTAVLPVAEIPPVPVAASQASRAASVPVALPGKLVNRQVPVKPAVAPAKPKPASAPTAKPAETDPRKILDGLEERKAPIAAAKPVAGKYFVQIGAFAEPAKIQQLTAKLKAAGLPVIAEKVKTTKGDLTRIRVGPATDEARAETLRKKAEAAGVPGKVVK